MKYTLTQDHIKEMLFLHVSAQKLIAKNSALNYRDALRLAAGEPDDEDAIETKKMQAHAKALKFVEDHPGADYSEQFFKFIK